MFSMVSVGASISSHDGISALDSEVNVRLWQYLSGDLFALDARASWYLHINHRMNSCVRTYICKSEVRETGEMPPATGGWCM
jgi:hypothetical protein